MALAVSVLPMLALDSSVVALEVATAYALSPLIFGLSMPVSPLVASVASLLGSFRSVIQEPDLSSLRLAAIPTATSKGSTSLMRRHSHLADFGHALSLVWDKPNDSATTSSFL